MDDAGRLEAAIHAAREGGRVALAHLGDPIYFKLKDRRDLLLGASLVVQDTIRQSLPPRDRRFSRQAVQMPPPPHRSRTTQWSGQLS